ncbi:YoaK family protein [Bacillus kwashiorkori]|uniref:YoaK family protein n=1 Tax=Bacillus kwashiorkori TaxID=1522318 RepID=UPI000A7B6DE8|nr:YoaK family protein [Bacillus kwashiorkori]
MNKLHEIISSSSDTNQPMIPSLSSNSVYLGIMLAIVGGFLDAYTFISRDGVFANAQTGNIVLLGVSLASGEWKQMLNYIPPIGAFIVGVLVSETFKRPKVKYYVYSSRRAVLLLEFFVLVIVGFLPQSVPNIIITVCIGFVSSLQISTFNKLDKWNYNSTMTTGNLRTATQAAYKVFVEKNKEAVAQFKEFSVVILSFLLGAILGSITTLHLGDKSIWLAAIIIFISLILYHKDRGYYRKKSSSN